jgi:hypothetical protein
VFDDPVKRTTIKLRQRNQSDRSSQPPFVARNAAHLVVEVQERPILMAGNSWGATVNNGDLPATLNEIKSRQDLEPQI